MSWFNDFVTQASTGLGISTGDAAAKTASKIIKDIKATDAATTAANLPQPIIFAGSSFSEAELLKYGGILAAGVVLYLLMKKA